MEQAPRTATLDDGDARPDKSSYEIFIAVMTLFSLVTLAPALLQRGFGISGHAFEEIANLLLLVDFMFSALFFVGFRALLESGQGTPRA